MLTHRNVPVHSANAIVISDLNIPICEMHSRLPKANKLIGNDYNHIVPKGRH